MLKDIRDVEKFFKDAGTYYLATMDEGNQPRVRPFGTALVFEGKLYLQTGLKKNVGKQLMKPGAKVEMCAFLNGEWLRVSGEAVYDPRPEAQKAVLDAYPSLSWMYAVDDGNNAVFYLKNATAVLSSFTHEPETISF
jgi:uncharacterized pyridoxamine 5'-phosphate oxidase family protein